jgi:hypothetical protein
MNNPEAYNKLPLPELVRSERLRELDDASLIISYQAQVMGVDLENLNVQLNENHRSSNSKDLNN